MSETEKPSVGVVLFDDVHRHKSGWAALYGESSCIRVRGSEDLPTEVVWLTNLPYEIMLESGLGRHARFRRSDYLRTKIDQIINELGLQDSDPTEQAPVLADIFGRTMALAQHLYGVEGVPLMTLRHGFKEQLAAPDLPLPNALTEAMLDATQEFVQCERVVSRTLGGRRRLVFRLPRTAHALDVLSMPVPIANKRWRSLSRKELPGPRDDPGQWVLAQPGPMVIRASLQAIDEDINGLINYGGGVISRRRKIKGKFRAFVPTRSWMTSQELLQLSYCARVTVKDAYLCEATEVPKDLLPAGGKIEPMTYVSYSFGLLMENIWTAAATTQGVGNLRGRVINPAMAFMRAHDRIRCLMAAVALQAQGLEVTAYGVGHIYALAMDTLSDAELAGICRQTGVVPQMLNISEARQDHHQSDPLSVMQTLHIRGRLDALMDLDGKSFRRQTRRAASASNQPE